MLKRSCTTGANPCEPDAPLPATDIGAEFPLPPIPTRQAQGLDQGLQTTIYIAGSRAHEHILRTLGITAFQIGVTGRRHFDDRIADKRRRRYGSVMMDPGHPEDGSYCLMSGGDVFLYRITDDMLTDVTMPPGFAVSGGVIVFRVKPHVTTEQVDKVVGAALAGRSLNLYLATPDGQRRMRDAGFNPRHRLVTAYSDIGPLPRFSVANEIYLVRPQRELQGLLNLLAKALAGLLAP